MCLGQHQQHQQHHDGTDVDRAGGEGLITPIPVLLSHILAELPIGIFQSRFVPADLPGRSALGIGDQEGERFFDPVTPAGHVIAIETTGLHLVGRRSISADRQFARSARGVLAVFPCAPQQAKVAAKCQHHRHQPKARSLRKVDQRARSDAGHEFSQQEKQDQDREVIRHLHVVHHDLQRKEKPQHHGTQKHSSTSVKQINATQYKRHVTDSAGLARVPGGKDHEEVR